MRDWNTKIMNLRARWIKKRIDEKPGINPDEKAALAAKEERQPVYVLDNDDLENRDRIAAIELAFQYNKLQRRLVEKQ